MELVCKILLSCDFYIGKIKQIAPIIQVNSVVY